MIYNQSSPTSLKCHHDQIIKYDLLESYFLEHFAENMTSRDLYITKDECVSMSGDVVIAQR
jgi:hypothetical protein